MVISCNPPVAVTAPTHSRGLRAIADVRARVLILGSLPGARSLHDQQYYAHPRNHFWWVMDEVLGVPRTLAYPDRVECLLERRVAVWDVLASGVRPGSLDSAIDLPSAAANDFDDLLAGLPSLQRLVFNGALADRIYRQRVLPGLRPAQQAIARIRLPSTSPANASVPPAAKLAAWRAALTDLQGAQDGRKGVD